MPAARELLQLVRGVGQAHRVARERDRDRRCRASTRSECSAAIASDRNGSFTVSAAQTQSRPAASAAAVRRAVDRRGRRRCRCRSSCGASRAGAATAPGRAPGPSPRGHRPTGAAGSRPARTGRRRGGRTVASRPARDTWASSGTALGCTLIAAGTPCACRSRARRFDRHARRSRRFDARRGDDARRVRSAAPSAARCCGVTRAHGEPAVASPRTAGNRLDGPRSSAPTASERRPCTAISATCSDWNTVAVSHQRPLDRRDRRAARARQQREHDAGGEVHARCSSRWR